MKPTPITRKLRSRGLALLAAALALVIVAAAIEATSAQAPPSPASDQTAPTASTAPQPGTTPTPDGSSASRSLPLTSTVAQGTVSPSRQFAYYQFQYPGDQSPVWITITFDPGDPITVNASGFNVYRPDGIMDTSGNLGAPPGLPQSPPNSKTIPFKSQQAGVFTIQVYTYSPNTRVGYTLSVIGLPLPTPTPTKTGL